MHFQKDIDMFPRTSVFIKTAKNPLTCSRKRKVQKISPRHQSKRLKPCGVYSVDAKSQLMRILYFRHFYKHFVFEEDAEGERKKVLKKYIDVNVCIDMGCGNTTD